MFKKMIIHSIGIITTFGAQSAENYGGAMCGAWISSNQSTAELTEEKQREDYQKQFTIIINEGYEYSISKFEKPADELEILIFKNYQYRAYFSIGYILQNCYTSKVPQEHQIGQILSELSERNGIMERTCFLEGIVLALKLI